MLFQQTHSATKYRLGYVPALNGLRGIAVLAVVIYHGAPHRLVGGMLGVDLFFVISGFLITTLLAKEFLKSGKIQFGKFYLRRLLRLAPALLAACVLFGIVASIVDPAHRLSHWIDSGIASVYMGNWTRALGLQRPEWLGHTWSLAIEEQYYLIWPIALLLLLRTKRSLGWIAGFVAGVAFLSWAWRAYSYSNGWSMDRVYNGTDTRLDGLLMGSAFALIAMQDKVKIWLREWHFRLPWLGIVMLLGFVGMSATMHLNSEALYLYGFGFVGICGVILVSEVMFAEKAWTKKLLEAKPFVWIGDYSYGIYLWHILVLRIFVWQGRPWYEFLTIGFALTLLLVVASYKWIESPALRLKSRLG